MRLRFRNNIAAVIIILMMFFAFNLSGVGTVRSATRMGYVTNEGRSNWSASYTLLDGTMRRTVYCRFYHSCLNQKSIIYGTYGYSTVFNNRAYHRFFAVPSA